MSEVRRLPSVLATNGLIALVTLAFAVIASAQPPLHEEIDDLEAIRAVIRARVGETAGDQPGAVVHRGRLLEEPTGGPLREDEHPMEPESGGDEARDEPGKRSPSYRPDRQTSLNATLGYYSVFEPSIAPFKRVTSLDAVVLAADGTPVLGVNDPRPQPVEVESQSSPPPDARPRDRFWGSVVLDFKDANTVPMPSVSPESRILGVRTEPEASLRFSRDAAGNYTVTRARSAPSQMRLTFLTDAPDTYFNVSAVPDAPVNALSSHVPPMPNSVRQDALTFAAELGLNRGSTLRQAIDVLTDHFRGFEESDEPPSDTGNMFLDLARGERGVCRHRAYAFLITAQSLGIPTRFVHNEAHAWVEVELPELGFIRIDLGGAATGLEAHGMEDRSPYQPEYNDPLPKPPEYLSALEQANGLPAGILSQGEEGQEGRGGEQGAAGGNHEGQRAGSTPADPTHFDENGVPISSQEPITEAREGEEVTTKRRADQPAPERLVFGLTTRRFNVFRGRQLEVAGSLRTARERDGVKGLRVEALLYRGGEERLLGVTVTGRDGSFAGQFGVPPGLPVGRYRLILRTPGSDAYLPAELDKN